MKHSLYLCDPKKNINCTKESCYINNGPCSSTTKPEFAFTNEKGEPIKEHYEEEKEMKIIKQGKTKEELKGILNKTRRFECKTCGCIFEADKGEYTHTTQYNETHYYCKCPNCKIHNAYEVKMR